MDGKLLFDLLNIPVWLPALFPIIGLLTLIKSQRTL